MRLHRVVAPHFVAGVLVDDSGVVVHAAPILSWALGRDLGALPPHWEVQAVETRAEKLLKTLAEDAAVCDACALHKSRTKSVFARGSAEARLMFVGEAPGQTEDEVGEPFVGAAGELLNKMIDAMGVTEYYIANTVKCRPPENRTPSPMEIGACSGFLAVQIKLVGPKVIVALGKTAALALTMMESGRTGNAFVFSSNWRGSWFTYADIPVMPTYHPAYLLRDPGKKNIVGVDLAKAMKRLKEAS
jgi:uracil-DNA glycosylase family 4